MRQKRHPAPKKAAPSNQEPRIRNPEPGAQNRGPSKLSFKEQKELEKLPARIEALEAEQERLNAVVAAPSFYKESAESIHTTLARLEEIQQGLLDAYARWDELDSRSSG